MCEAQCPKHSAHRTGPASTKSAGNHVHRIRRGEPQQGSNIHDSEPTCDTASAPRCALRLKLPHRKPHVTSFLLLSINPLDTFEIPSGHPAEPLSSPPDILQKGVPEGISNQPAALRYRDHQPFPTFSNLSQPFPTFPTFSLPTLPSLPALPDTY